MPLVASGKPQVTSGMPQAASGMPQVATGMPQVAAGMPQVAPGMPQVAAGTCQVAAGMPLSGRWDALNGRWDAPSTGSSIANEMRRPFVTGPLVALGRCATDFSSENYSRFLSTKILLSPETSVHGLQVQF